MAQTIPMTMGDRFVNNNLSELEDANWSPIYGYQNLSTMTLEESVQSIIRLIPGVIDLVAAAKEKCNRNSNILTWDESAATYLYTMPTCFYSCLNENLRVRNRQTLKPWFAFLKLFLGALEKLPSVNIVVWRGVQNDFGFPFIENATLTWWSVTSCSQNVQAVERFIGEFGYLFSIEAVNGKDISMYSIFPEEQEVILMPGTCLRVKTNPFNFQNRLLVVPLKEESAIIQTTQIGGNLPNIVESIPHQRTIVIRERKSSSTDPQFYSDFPQELAGIIDPTEFQQSITNINNTRQKTGCQELWRFSNIPSCVIRMMISFIAIVTMLFVSTQRYNILKILYSICLGIIVVTYIISVCVSNLATKFTNARMTAAINAESTRYSRRLSIPITWRLHMTSHTITVDKGQRTIVDHFIIIEIGRNNVSQTNLEYQ